MDIREKSLTNWLKETLIGSELRTFPLVGDASFRRYFRVQTSDKSLVAMDAPPELEDSHSFVAVQEILSRLGLCVPELFHVNLQEGFLLMSDLGDQLFLKHVSQDNADLLYRNALKELLTLQQCDNIANLNLPHFDKSFMKRELDNFTEWFLQKYLGLTLTAEENTLLSTVYEHLLEEAANQPQVFVHRDYHSRNLMILSNNRIGILDFQDAVLGPITYDLASLLRDCYVDWPKSQVLQWVYDYQSQAQNAGIIAPVSQETFLKWFDWMGMQRHLKAIFIFARKKLRDNDGNYLKDIPRALNYLKDVSHEYPEFQDFHRWIDSKIIPRFQEVTYL